MRKLLIVGAAIAFAFSACKPDKKEEGTTSAGITVEKKNMGIIQKFTGTNCYYCGDWGWTMMKDIVKTYHKKDAIVMGAYSQNNFAQLLVSQTATDFDKRLPVTKGYPTFAANFTDAWSGGNTLSGMNNVISTQINSHKSATVVANAGFNSKIEGNNMIVDTKVQFFTAADGEYYVGAYILEDGVVANQSGPNGGANAVHDQVLRLSGNSWGVQVANGAIAANASFTKTITIPIDPSWNKDKLTVFTAIWKKNGTKYDFVNAYIKS